MYIEAVRTHVLKFCKVRNLREHDIADFRASQTASGVLVRLAFADGSVEEMFFDTAKVSFAKVRYQEVVS